MFSTTARTYGALQTKLEQEEKEEDMTDGNVFLQIWYQWKHLDGGQELLRWCRLLAVAQLLLKVHGRTTQTSLGSSHAAVC